MTTNAKLFEIEFYRAGDAEESDPDPMFKAEADNTEDLFTQLSAFANVDHYEYRECDNGSLMYEVYGHDTADRTIFLGVAYVIYPK